MQAQQQQQEALTAAVCASVVLSFSRSLKHFRFLFPLPPSCQRIFTVDFCT
jgi:hypothetical protein